MKAVMPVVHPEILESRKRTGADRWDEVWEGVLHMPPMPNYAHQNLEAGLQNYLWLHWARPNRAKVLHQINLAPAGGWPDNYRIPDLVLLTPARSHINKGQYFEGAPDVVVEIRSPEDESYDKLSFYADLGVPEVWIIDRDTKEPEIHLLKKKRYKKQSKAANGWFRSPGTGIEMRAGRPGKLAIRVAGEDSTREELPED